MRYLMLLPVMLASTTAEAKDGEARSTQAPSQQAGPSIELSSGIEYEEGDYGTGRDVQTIRIPSTLRITSGRLQAYATLPYVRIEGPANVRPSSGFMGLPIIIDPTVPSEERITREGMGDLRLGASYGIPTPVVDLALSGEVKLPTASNGLGTGKTDFAVGAEIAKDLGGAIPFAAVTYNIPGDPENYSLKNSFGFRAGMAAPIGNQTRGYVYYSRGQSLSTNVPDEERIVGGLNSAIGKRLSVGAFGTAGLSDGSPDVGAGIRLGVRIR